MLGLGRLRWYCQVCEKQCRDENGFQVSVTDFSGKGLLTGYLHNLLLTRQPSDVSMIVCQLAQLCRLIADPNHICAKSCSSVPKLVKRFPTSHANSNQNSCFSFAPVTSLTEFKPTRCTTSTFKISTMCI